MEGGRADGGSLWGLRRVEVKREGGTKGVGLKEAFQEAYHEAKADILTSIQRGVCAHLAAADSEQNTDH